MPYLTIDGASVYHEVQGRGEPLVLLHGGFCSIEAMREFGDILSRRFTVHSPERAGHGRTADHGGPFTYPGMAAETIAYLDAVGLPSAHIVGFSDGGITALLLARDHAERVRSLVAISANVDASGYVPPDHPHVTMPADALERLHREYAELSPDGAEHAADLLGRLLSLWEAGPAIPLESLGAIAARSLLVVAEHDEITLDHTEAIAAAIRDATIRIVPGSTHMLVAEQPALVAEHVLAFVDPAPDPAGQR